MSTSLGGRIIFDDAGTGSLQGSPGRDKKVYIKQWLELAWQRPVGGYLGPRRRPRRNSSTQKNSSATTPRTRKAATAAPPPNPAPSRYAVMAMAAYTTSRCDRAVIAGCSKCVDAGQLLADDELVHRFGALVGDDAFEVECMAYRHVLGADAGAAQDIAGVAGNIDGHTNVVPFGHRDLGWLHRTCVFHL